MNLKEIGHVYASQAIWRMTGSHSSGRSLVRALDSDDETTRTVAGMFLTRFGERAEPLLLDALKTSAHAPTIIMVLGSIGDPKLVAQLEPYTESKDSSVAKAAKHAIKVIEAGFRQS